VYISKSRYCATTHFLLARKCPLQSLSLPQISRARYHVPYPEAWPNHAASWKTITRGSNVSEVQPFVSRLFPIDCKDFTDIRFFRLCMNLVAREDSHVPIWLHCTRRTLTGVLCSATRGNLLEYVPPFWAIHGTGRSCIQNHPSDFLPEPSPAEWLSGRSRSHLRDLARTETRFPPPVVPDDEDVDEDDDDAASFRTTPEYHGIEGLLVEEELWIVGARAYNQNGVSENLPSVVELWPAPRLQNLPEYMADTQG